MKSVEAPSPAQPASRAVTGALLAMAFRSAGVLAVLAVPVISGLGSVDGGTPGARPDEQQSSTWRESWSVRYPGCVPSVLWPADENPTALLTRGPDGRIHKVALGPGGRLTGAVSDARTVGACR